MTPDTDIRVGVYCCERRAGKASLDDAQRMARSMEGRMRVQSIRLYVDVETEGRGPRPERVRLIESCKEGEINYIAAKSVANFANRLSDVLSLAGELRAIPGILGMRFEKEGVCMYGGNVKAIKPDLA